VTGIAASVWGQIYKVEPAIVIELIQEQINNKLPDDVRQLLTGVHYNVLGYDESDKLRPVGSLDAITKIAQVYLLEVHKINVKEIADKTVDHAIQTDHGMAKMTATLKAKVTQAIDARDSDFAVLKVDITSAFPNSNRQHMRTAVSKLLPQFLGMFDFLYARPNHHTFNTSDQGLQKIEQRQGIIQGSELSMLFFMLYTHLPLSAHLDQINDHVLKYADDIYVYGPTDEVSSSYKVLKDAYNGIELDFNPTKQELYLPAASTAELDHIEHLWPETKITNHGVTCLGVPVGNLQWTAEQLDSHLERATANLQLCTDNCSAQVTLKLLQHTASAYQHIVTVLPPEETLQFAEDIDEVTTDTFNRSVIGTQQHQIDDQTLAAIEIRTRMRLRDGGFGILSLKDRVPFAVVSTAVKISNDADDGDPKSKRAMDAIESAPTMLESIQQWTDDALSRLGNKHNLATLRKMSMAEMLLPVYQQYVQNARDHLDGEMLQAWAATQHAGANDVIAIAPNREESTLTDYELRYAIYQRLGLLGHLLELDRLNSPNGSCLACNKPNITAAHFSNCGHSCKEKHDRVVRLCHEMLETAGVNARVELQVPNAQRKIDLFYQDPKPDSINIKNVMADVTIIQAYSPDHLTLPDTTRLLNTASRAKTNKYRTDAANWRARVQPLSYTTFGAISKDARDWLDSVEQAAIAGAQYFPGIDRRFRVVWRENISFEIARQTAAMAQKGIEKHAYKLAGFEDSE
jgi:predicted small metal-binding protein